MKAHYINGLKYYSFDSLDKFGVIHGFFTRGGGVSPEPWNSLNTAQTVGDTREHVIENRRRIFSALSREVGSIFDVWQVHSDVVLHVDAPRPLNQAHQKADGILASDPNITLMMRFADCVPILLYDTNSGAAGIVHAGWKGTVYKIVAKAVKKLCTVYQTRPESIYAYIGPSIGPDHYEVGEDVVNLARSSFFQDKTSVLHKKDGRTFLDLWQANVISLEQEGVRHIELAGLCTACNTNEWFSHRGDKGRSGRFAVLLVPGRSS